MSIKNELNQTTLDKITSVLNTELFQEMSNKARFQVLSTVVICSFKSVDAGSQQDDQCITFVCNECDHEVTFYYEGDLLKYYF